jgi:hypothetical protein
MNDIVERRRHDRFEFPQPVQIFPVLPSKSGNIYEVQNHSIEFKARDISEGGLRIEVDRPFDSNFLIKLNFEVLKDQPVEVYGKIIWSENNHCGIRFMLADEVLRKGIGALALKSQKAN